MDSCNGEVTFGITGCIVLKVYIGSVKNRAREGTDGSRVDGLAFVLIRIRAGIVGSGRGRRGRGWRSGSGSTGGGSEFKTTRFISTTTAVVGTWGLRWGRVRLIRMGITHKGSAVVDVLDVRCGKREERMLVSGTRDRSSGGRLLTQELLSLQEQRLSDGSKWVKTAEQYCREEIIGAHLGPEIAGFPGIHHLLDFSYSLQRRGLGFSFREMESHGIKQVIIECHE